MRLTASGFLKVKTFEKKNSKKKYSLNSLAKKLFIVSFVLKKIFWEFLIKIMYKIFIVMNSMTAAVSGTLWCWWSCYMVLAQRRATFVSII